VSNGTLALNPNGSFTTRAKRLHRYATFRYQAKDDADALSNERS